MHNMDEKMGLPNHVTKRGATYQYVRRIPDDIASAFGISRIQRSLRTGDRTKAFSEAAKVNEAVEQQFSEARAKLGIALDLQETSDWTITDWEQVAQWFEARLIHDDLQRRLPKLKGAALVGDPGRQADHWSDDTLYKEQIELRRSLESMSVESYATERLNIVNAVIRRIGVSMLPTSPIMMSFAASCLKAELNAIDIFFRRDRGELIPWIYPDDVLGRWRKPNPPETSPLESLVSAQEIAPVTSTVGKTLTDCQEQWKADRALAKKSIRDAYVKEMSYTIALFETTQKITDIGEITRKHVITFRSHLATSGKFEIATINKKCSFITTLLATAESHAWIDNAVRGNIHLDVPEEDENKEPYSDTELTRIFGHKIFTGGPLFDRVKAGRELQFWLPVISCTHGMMSSEIIQLGPDTIVPYPGTNILCFNVTNAGGRYTKELARRRYMPIRERLLDIGLHALVERARRNGWSTLWSAVEARDGDTRLVASMFSAFWSPFGRRELEITDEEKTLYSLRHNFKDAMRKLGVPKNIADMLMGHAESGTGRRYGTKRSPKPVPIHKLNKVVQSLEWSFLEGLVAPPLEEISRADVTLCVNFEAGTEYNSAYPIWIYPAECSEACALSAVPISPTNCLRRDRT